MIIYTIGHSTRTIENFLAILSSFEIETVADVRTIARSRHNPQYNETELSISLSGKGISYVRLKELGGLRHTTKASINIGWSNPSFRGYADYMQSSEFIIGIDRLIQIANGKRTCIMCAEAVPWRCHRSLIGDALIVRNISVEDILSEQKSRSHNLTQFARVEYTTITYPAPTKS